MSEEIMQIPLNEIHLDEAFNCRGPIKPTDVIDLAKSIEEQGLIQPIVVHPYTPDLVAKTGKKYRIIAGHRRFVAHQVLARDSIKAVINTTLDDMGARIANFVENIQRKNLNIVEEATSLAKFFDAGMTEMDVVTKTATSRGWVQVRKMILALPEEIYKDIISGVVTQTHIRDLYTIVKNHPDGVSAVYEAVKDIKDAKLHGVTKSINLKARSEKTDKNRKRQRSKEEIMALINHLLDYFGESITTVSLAWASGNVSDEELFTEFKKEATRLGKDYIPPTMRSKENDESGN